METNDNAREYRALAWTRLWSERWFGRLVGGAVLLNLGAFAVNLLLGGVLNALGVEDWYDYECAKALNRVDVTVPVPNLTQDYVIRATAATVLETFIGYILAAIVAYGMAVILLRCLKNEERGYLKAAFGGFKDPLGMGWLFFRRALIYLGWLLAALVPLMAIRALMGARLKTLLVDSQPVAAGLMATGWVLVLLIVLLVLAVPFYRYRFVYLIKAEHPDWRAGACLGECKRLMRGHMLESFKLDCSYWKAITVVLLLTLLLVAIRVIFVCIAGVIVLDLYISVGQGFFYRKLMRDRLAAA